jgi:hypothetical protein
MSIYQHALWGYQLTYPDDWLHQSVVEADGLQAEAFAAGGEAFQPGYDGPRSGQIAVRAEWNPTRAEVEGLWERKIGLLASMMGATQVGAAPWKLRPAGATGVEAEIVLPKREKIRLWTGILARGFHVLHFMVTHPKDERDWFEPIATQIISSLSFAERIEGLEVSPQGLPLPPGYVPVAASQLVQDIAEPELWRGYAGASPADALQAFYVREAPNRGWEILEYRPFPQNVEMGFARFKLGKVGGNGSGRVHLTVGIMPYGKDTVSPNSPANIVVRLG